MKKINVAGNLFDFSIEFCDNGIFVKAKSLKDYPIFTRILLIILENICTLLALIATIITASVMPPINVYSIMFSIVTVISAPFFISKLLMRNKEAKAYKFEINESGIRYKTTTFDSFISWDEVCTYGISNHIKGYVTALDYGRNLHNWYNCIYFAKKPFDEKQLRKTLFHFTNYEFERKNLEKDAIIALSFRLRIDELEIYQEFCNYIKAFCDKEKEVNYYT